MESLIKEVQDSIEKSLPAMQAEAIRKFITEANYIKQKYEPLVENYNQVKKELDRLSALESRIKTLDAATEALRIERLTFEVEKKLLQAEVSKHDAVATAIRGVVNDVFRNVEVRRNIFGSDTAVNNNTGYTTSLPTNREEKINQG